jgi:DDE superfamily endonuclease/putative transposase ISC1217
MILPPEAAPLLASFAPLFSQPTLLRFATLSAAAILTTGRRTIANLLRTLGPLAPGHRTTYQRLLSAARYSGLELGCALARFLLQHLVPDGTVYLVIDDTIDGHKGKCVYGKARHRDAVRSTHSYTAWRYGHRWIVLAILVRLPFTTRLWALPVLIDLYRSPEQDQAEGRPHRTPTRLACRLLRLLLIRFPDRKFMLVADSTYGTHELARFCHRHRSRLTFISKRHPDAALYEPPPPYAGTGRRRVKGERLPSPREVVATAPCRQLLRVGWYGGLTRGVAIITRAGRWYRVGRGAIPIRWVHVEDRTGTHRDEYLFTTDPNLTPTEVITRYTARWNIETTFQECRSSLGLETTRGWCRRTVLRAAPCLFGLYSVIALLYRGLPVSKRSGGVAWPGKSGVSFSDALVSVRRWLWREGVFPQSGAAGAFEKLPPSVRELLLHGLAPAA